MNPADIIRETFDAIHLDKLHPARTALVEMEGDIVEWRLRGANAEAALADAEARLEQVAAIATNEAAV